MEYVVKAIQHPDQLMQCEPFHVNHYNWGGTYRPKTIGRLAYLEGEGFYLHMTCEESDPRRVFTQENDPVYQDSCMEAFLNFDPQNPVAGYLNFEMNANGVLLSEYGTGRGIKRRYLRDMGIDTPTPVAQIQQESWSTQLFIPLALIQAVYGDLPFSKGYAFRANFYKCGDETHTPHFGSWAPIHTPGPDFHVPSDFGTLRLG